ncbi:MAG: hypothetical protein KGI54_17225 [Pseudomonadota bacterium]|nr:hypothetical protein [Pseudomonadota bacterium]
MTDTNQTVVAVTSAIEKLSSDVAHQATQYGPQAVQLATEYIHVQAIITTAVWGIIFLLLCAILWAVMRFLIVSGIHEKDHERFGFGMFAAIAVLLLTGIPFIIVVQPDNLMGLFTPKLELVHMALKAASSIGN